MAKNPMTLKQMDKLDTLALRLDRLIKEVKDEQVRYHLDEAARRLSFAARRAQGLDE